MPALPIERRPSYGSASPAIGPRGERTRQRIVDEALRLFDSVGFHATMVDDIVTAAEVSRATLYQYFESKEALFVELVNLSGAELLRALSAARPFGPTAEGFRNLRAWVADWSEVFRRYSTVFIEWAHVNTPDAPIHEELAKFLEAHTRRLSKHLRAASVKDADAQGASVLILALLERGHYLRHLYLPDELSAKFEDELAIAFQCFLFPETRDGTISRVTPPHPPRRPRPTTRTAVVHQVPDLRDRFAELRPQGRRTVESLLDAAASVLTTKAYADANIDDIVSLVGVARGTFYRYFSDKLDIVKALSTEAIRDLDRVLVEMPDASPWSLRTLFDGHLHFFRRYAGVVRIWTERVPNDPDVLAMAARATELTRRSLASLRRTNGHDTYVGRTVGLLVFTSLLEWFPARAAGTRCALDDATVIDLQIRFAMHGLLRERPGA